MGRREGRHTRKNDGRRSITKAVLKTGIIIALIGFLSATSLEAWSHGANFLREVRQLKEQNAGLADELSTMRNFLLDSCQQENDVRKYLFLPDKNCGKYFPDLITREVSPKPLEEEFLAAFHSFMLEPDELLVAAMEQEETPKADSAEEGEMTATANTIEEIGLLDQNEELKSYLAEYGYLLEPFGENGIHLKQDGLERADIYWDAETGSPKINILDQEKIISLRRLSGRIYEWKEAQKTQVREEMLDKIRNIESDSTPRHNILLLGKNGGNVDTMMLCSIDNVRKTVTVISIPRDLWIDSRKANSLYTFFGMDFFLEKMEEVLGQKIQNYVLIDMMAFPNVIDAIGGIKYTFARPLIDPSYRTVDNGEEGTLFFSSGTHHLNGIQALRVARTRNTTSDFHRAERQQQLIGAIKEKLGANGTIESVIAITPLLFRYVTTDLNPTEAAKLFWEAKAYDFRFGNVMSTKNILNSSMLPLGNGLRTYVLLPRDNDWDLIPKFIWTSLLKEE